MASELANKYDVCFDIISTADEKRNLQMLKNVASINACSRVITFDQLYQRPEVLTGSLIVVTEKIIMTPETMEKLVGVKVPNILFDLGRSNVESKFSVPLNKLAAFLKENPQAYVILAGFTCDTGSQENNLELSRHRAEAVGNYLIDNLGVAEEQIVLNWYGEAAPAATNSTDEGRRQNRRVAIIVSGL
jgi:OOP family OmpA-OmpF porin